MINNQMIFYITKEKEKELFSYIMNECDCKIYRLYRSGEKETFETNDEISDFTYFIKTNSIHQDVIYEKDGDNMSLYPFDSQMNFYPFVLYERPSAENADELVSCRLYLSKSVKKEYKSVLKKTYKQISDWIKKNSCKREKDGFFKLYYVE